MSTDEPVLEDDAQPVPWLSVFAGGFWAGLEPMFLLTFLIATLGALCFIGAQVWIRGRAAEAAARAKIKRELAEAKRHEAIEQLKMMEAERELRAAEEDVERLQRELSAPRDAHEDMARQELQRLLDEHLVLYNAPSDRMRCLAMLRKIASNVLDDPTNPKVQRIKAKNPALCEAVMSVRGGRAFLVAMGFVPKVVDFEEYFQLLTPPIFQALGDGQGEEGEAADAEAVAQAAQRKRLDTAVEMCTEAIEEAQARLDAMEQRREAEASAKAAGTAPVASRGRLTARAV